jgi:hypothetical protein
MATRTSQKDVDRMIQYFNDSMGTPQHGKGSFTYDINSNGYYRLMLQTTEGGGVSDVGGGLKIGDFCSALNMAMSARRAKERYGF